MTSPSLAFVGLGSNLGDSPAIIRRALRRLEDLSQSPPVCSSLWRTTPVDCPAGSPSFVNAVAGFEPREGQSPQALLEALQRLEREFGRPDVRQRNQARVLDLDLLAWGDRTVHGPQLILPHPRAHLRRFVLEPLAELAPGLRLPGQGATVRELAAQLRSDERVEKI